ncbi:MAG: type II toxin-antitoxin system Phd/YefM family antitoxin [Myxococcota bacterium]
MRSKAHRTRTVALAKVKDDLSRYLRLASEGEVVITRHGRPAGVLIGFEDEEAWIDYRIENHPEFLERVAGARKALREGRGVPIEDV